MTAIVRKEVTPHIILSANASDKSRAVWFTFLYFWRHEWPSTAGHLLPGQDFGKTERREAGVERDQGLGARH